MCDAINKGRWNPKELNQPRGNNHWSRKKPERVSCGGRHWRSKLTEEIVREARKKHSDGTSIVNLARKYGVGGVTMRDALTGYAWKHVV